MNRLKKIFSFVLCLSFSLFFNVSYAEEFLPLDNITVNINYAPSRYQNPYSIIDDYTFQKIYNTVNGYYKGTVSQSDYDNLINAIINNGYDYTFVLSSYSGDNYMPYIFKGFDVTTYNNSYEYMCFKSNSSENTWYNPDNQNGYGSTITNLEICFRKQINGTLTVVDSSVSVKRLTPVNNNTVYWDGETYSYKVETEEETPVPPSNAEIAQAVQAFYNSDYYKNNKDFKDFIVMYNYKTKYFDFIGHNYDEKIQQLIFPAGHKYNQQWWKFSLDGLTTELLANITNKYYWLYSTNDFGENIKYEGKGSINDLLDLHFSTSSIIVYSTTDYDVVYYTFNENNELTSEMAPMPGDQYTYDEKLDPTTNEYNPLKDFVPTDPSQSILGDVDFNEINKVFEENKDILNIKNASWLFTANNQLVNYFIGFLSFLIVLIIISRLLGG